VETSWHIHLLILHNTITTRELHQSFRTEAAPVCMVKS